MRHPVVRRVSVPLLVKLGRPPDIPVAILVVLGASRLLEPLMLIAGVVDHQIHQRLHPPFVAALDEALDVLDRAVLVRDAVVVRDVIAHVDLGRLVDRTQPDDVDTQLLDVVQLGDDAGKVADAVIVGVLERGRIDLVDGAFLPPRPVDVFALVMLVRLRCRGCHC